MTQVTPGGSLSLPWSICPLLSPAWPSLLAKVSPESLYVHLIIEVYIQGLRGGWIIRAEELLLEGKRHVYSQCNCMLTQLACSLSFAIFKGCVMLGKAPSFSGLCHLYLCYRDVSGQCPRNTLLPC